MPFLRWFVCRRVTVPGWIGGAAAFFFTRCYLHRRPSKVSERRYLTLPPECALTHTPTLTHPPTRAHTHACASTHVCMRSTEQSPRDLPQHHAQGGAAPGFLARYLPYCSDCSIGWSTTQLMQFVFAYCKGIVSGGKVVEDKLVCKRCACKV